MPFPDELARGLAVVAYDDRWPGEFAALAGRIQAALGPAAVRVSHVGSTSVPGLAAKDCIDVQVEVRALAEAEICGCFETTGFRLRPEPWNHAEPVPGGECPKLVFAPPQGERASNIHVLEAGCEAARRKLLFRDFLRAHATARDSWSAFKHRLAEVAPRISTSTARPRAGRPRSCSSRLSTGLPRPTGTRPPRSDWPAERLPQPGTGVRERLSPKELS